MLYLHCKARERQIMDNKIDFDIEPNQPVYGISVVSELIKIPIWTIRQLDKAGIVKPKRVGKKIRLYSNYDLKKLKFIQYLMETRKVNIHGVKVILEMDARKDMPPTI